MIKWLVETFFKEQINELVDKRFKEQMFERYYAKKANDLHERIQKLRQSVNVSQAYGVQEDHETKVQSNSVLEVSRQTESKLEPASSEAKLESQQRNSELDDLRAKLMGKKK